MKKKKKNMKKNKNNIWDNIFEKSWLNLFAWITFLTVLWNIGMHLYDWSGYWYELIWFCDFVALLLVFGIWTRNINLISTVLISAIPMQFLWILDFFLELSGNGLGRTEWLFNESTGILMVSLSTILHGVVIPTSFLWTLRLGFSKKSIYYYLFFAFLIVNLTYFLTPSIENINCLFYPCDIDYKTAFFEAEFYNKIYFTYLYVVKEFIEWFLYVLITYLVLGKLFDFLKKKRGVKKLKKSFR